MQSPLNMSQLFIGSEAKGQERAIVISSFGKSGISTCVGSGGDIWGTGDSEVFEEGHGGRFVGRYDMLVSAGKGIKSCDHGFLFTDYR